VRQSASTRASAVHRLDAVRQSGFFRGQAAVPRSIDSGRQVDSRRYGSRTASTAWTGPGICGSVNRRQSGDGVRFVGFHRFTERIVLRVFPTAHTDAWRVGLRASAG
jgi:hypothetical protein